METFGFVIIEENEDGTVKSVTPSVAYVITSPEELEALLNSPVGPASPEDAVAVLVEAATPIQGVN